MSDENSVLHSMELFPTVLERIIIGYIKRKEITFMPFNDNTGITIDGHQLSCSKKTFFYYYAAVSPTPLSQCRLRWKVELLSGHKSRCYIGIAFPSHKSNLLSINDITSLDSRFIAFYTTAEKDKMCIVRPESFGYEQYYCRSKYIVMEVDLMRCSLNILAEESDGICNDQCTKHITGKIQMFTNIPNLEQCFPFVTLHAANDCCVSVTSYN